MNDLKHTKTADLRREILLEAGIDPGDRFGSSGGQKGIRKANLIAVAVQLQPEGESVDYANARLTDIYSLIGKWAGVEHEGNAGRDWTMNRDLLKEIHREIHD